MYFTLIIIKRIGQNIINIINHEKNLITFYRVRVLWKAILTRRINWWNLCHPAVYYHYHTYRKLATVSLQTGRLLSLTRTLLLPVQRWHSVFRREGLPGRASNLPVLHDAGPFRTGSRSQRRTLDYRLFPLLVLLTVLIVLLIVRHRLRRWHWLVRSLFICNKKMHDLRIFINLLQNFIFNSLIKFF